MHLRPIRLEGRPVRGSQAVPNAKIKQDNMKDMTHTRLIWKEGEDGAEEESSEREMEGKNVCVPPW